MQMFRINNLKTIALLTLCQDRTMQYIKVQCQFYNYSLFQWVVFLVESRSSFDTNQPFSHSSVYVGLVLPAEVIYISFTLSFFHLLTTFWHVVSFFFIYFRTHLIFSELKKKTKGGHGIPEGSLFSLVSCPHYLCEIIIYTVFMLVILIKNGVPQGYVYGFYECYFDII